MAGVVFRVELQDPEDVQACGVAAVRFGLKVRSVDNGDGDQTENLQLTEATQGVNFYGIEIAVGRFVADWWKRREEHRRGGLVFDLTAAPGGVYRYEDVPYGDVVVITTDGELTLQVNGISLDSLERLLGKISAGTNRSIAGIEEFGRQAGARKLIEQPS